MNKQDEIKTGLSSIKLSKISYDGKVNYPHFLSPIDIKNILSYLHSQGVMMKVKCPDCEWSQFVDGESVGMTPCYSCNSTGYLVEPLIKEE